MNSTSEKALAEAAAWHAASVNDDMDWEAFTLWLDADPNHRHVYDEVALADSVLDEHRVALQSGSDELAADERNVARPGMAIWKRWAGVAIAASLVAVLAVPYLKGDHKVYETRQNARSIALNDGSTVVLAPHSRLTVEGRVQERMALDGGGWFDIRHNPSRPLVISVGQVSITDIGTQFDIQATGKQVRVEVAQGEVQVASPTLSQAIRLARGRGLLFDGEDGTAVVLPISGETVGEWRRGRLSYESAPLPLVVADLSRYAAIRVRVPDDLRGRRFSGTLVIGDGKAAIRDLSQVMDLELSHEPGGYRLAERRR